MHFRTTTLAYIATAMVMALPDFWYFRMYLQEIMVGVILFVGFRQGIYQLRRWIRRTRAEERAKERRGKNNEFSKGL